MNSHYHNVCVEGDPNEIDSFVACIAAVLHAWERPVNYDWIAGLAGVAFSPVLDSDEDCMAWWMESGSDARICFLAHALGFDVDRVTRDVPWDEAARAEYAATGMLPAPHESHFARLRAAFDRGDAILLRTWPSWSVLTGWHRDVDRLVFATVPGFVELVDRIWGPAKAQLAYVLSPTPVALTPEVALGKALCFGAKIADGRGPDHTLGYGTAIYVAAAEKMASGEFCKACGIDGDSCAHRTLMRMLGTQRSAVGFLEDSQTLVGETLPWDNAIDAFVAMTDVTSAYCAWEDFNEDWGNDAFRDGLRDDFMTLAELQAQAAEALDLLARAYADEVKA